MKLAHGSIHHQCSTTPMCFPLVYHFHIPVFSLRLFSKSEELGASGNFESCPGTPRNLHNIFDN